MALGERRTPSIEELKDTPQPLEEDEPRPKREQFCSWFCRGRPYHFGLVSVLKGDGWLLINLPAYRYMRQRFFPGNEV
jgi:hypothetical protein